MGVVAPVAFARRWPPPQTSLRQLQASSITPPPTSHFYCKDWISLLFSVISSPPINTPAKTRSKMLPLGPLASVLAALLIMLFVGGAIGRASSGWKPLGADDLDVTAASIGYPDADAAILLREGDLDDDSSEGTS